MLAFSSIVSHNFPGIDSGLLPIEYRVYASRASICCRNPLTCDRSKEVWPLGILAWTPSSGSPSRNTNSSKDTTPLDVSSTTKADRIIGELPTACPEYTISKTISSLRTFERNPAWHEPYVPYSHPGWRVQSPKVPLRSVVNDI